jgi:putative DNA primase/helicase
VSALHLLCSSAVTGKSVLIMQSNEHFQHDISVAAIAAALADNAESICAELLPNGERVGNEWRCGNVQGTSGKSLSVCLKGPKAGTWKDFATGEGGDLLDLTQAVRGYSKGEAVAWAKDYLGLNGEPVYLKPNLPDSNGTDTISMPVLPIPSNAVKAPPHPELGYPSQRWAYRNEEGGILALVCRFDGADGKTIRPLTYWRKSDGTVGWEWKHLPKPRPLYGLDRLAKLPIGTVHIVEGEKAADAAKELFPTEPCITWCGGTNAVTKADWTPLKGRRVVIWPDHDEPGRKASQAATESVMAIGATDVRIVHIPTAWPEKWDLADPVPDGEPSNILECLRREARPVNAVLTAPDSDDWPDPEPILSPAAAPRPYPVDALPRDMRDAVVGYQRYGQQPMELVASAAIATASLATQGLANIARDSVLIGPLSLNLLVIANSGERKTSADRRMARAAREWQDERREDMASEVSEAKARVTAYNAERDGILAKIKKFAGAESVDKPDELASLRKGLEELEAQPPKEPVLPRLFYEDATQEAFGLRLAIGWPSASIWSDEAGLVVGSHGMGDDRAMRFLGLLNRLWDGDPFERDRTTTESFKIKGRRLTACLMMQDVVLTKLLATSGGAARGVGFLARFLICRPSSTMGTRLYREGDAGNAANAGFDHRIRELLDHPLPTEGEDMGLAAPVLYLSPKAKDHWVEFHDEVEREIGSMGEYAAVGDIAAKTAENAARLAGVFHVFEHGPDGEVSAETMDGGARIAAWHLYEARRLIESNQEPQSILDACTLWDWLLKRGKTEFTHTE